MLGRNNSDRINITGPNEVHQYFMKAIDGLSWARWIYDTSTTIELLQVKF